MLHAAQRARETQDGSDPSDSVASGPWMDGGQVRSGDLWAHREQLGTYNVQGGRRPGSHWPCSRHGI